MHSLNYRQMSRIQRSPSLSSLSSGETDAENDSDDMIEQNLSPIGAMHFSLDDSSIPVINPNTGRTGEFPFFTSQIRRFWKSTGGLFDLLSQKLMLIEDNDKEKDKDCGYNCDCTAASGASSADAEARARIFPPLKTKKRKCTVKFNQAVKVILIPTKNDYKNARLVPILWYGYDDYPRFKREAIEEIRVIMKTRNVTVKEASGILYSATEAETETGGKRGNEDMTRKNDEILKPVFNSSSIPSPVSVLTPTPTPTPALISISVCVSDSDSDSDSFAPIDHVKSSVPMSRHDQQQDECLAVAVAAASSTSYDSGNPPMPTMNITTGPVENNMIDAKKAASIWSPARERCNKSTGTAIHFQNNTNTLVSGKYEDGKEDCNNSSLPPHVFNVEPNQAFALPTK